MANTTPDRPPGPPHIKAPTPTKPRPILPNPVLNRSGSVATRTPVPPNSEHPTVFIPWEQLAATAATRLRTEIKDALRVMNQRTGAAGTILDTAAASAAESAASLRGAAWAAWQRYMDAADRTENAILGPAVSAYDREIEAAHSAYDAAIKDALANYNVVLADARSAKAAAATIPTAV